MARQLLARYRTGRPVGVPPVTPVEPDPVEPDPVEPGPVGSIDTTLQSSVERHGITFEFDEAYPVGEFVSGDAFVVGPVTITSITPAFANDENGWEVNPVVWEGTPFSATFVAQGFTISADANATYDSTRVPSLPYTATTAQSIVKCISHTTSVNQSYVSQAEVLTVLLEAPPVGSFRPPYMHDDKPLHNIEDMQTNLIPSLSSTGVTNIPTLASIVTAYSSGLMMDHGDFGGRPTRPYNLMSPYQPANNALIHQPVLRFMLDDQTLEQKMPAIIAYTQNAIDRAYAVYNNYRHGSRGHNPGHRLQAGWAAAMFDITAIKNLLASVDSRLQLSGFQEDVWCYASPIDGRPLYGKLGNTEEQYWYDVATPTDNASHHDPYGFIDGGYLQNPGGSGGPGEAYQTIVAQSWKSSALCTRLMPALEVSWNQTFMPTFLDYADRWVTHGVWTVPDPYAPYNGSGDGDISGFGTHYGTSGGEPILGDGRFPDVHGLNTNGGQYQDTFIDSMWNTHRGE